MRVWHPRCSTCCACERWVASQPAGPSAAWTCTRIHSTPCPAAKPCHPALGGVRPGERWDSWARDCTVVVLCCQPVRPWLRLGCARLPASKCPAAQPPSLPPIPARPAAQPGPQPYVWSAPPLKRGLSPDDVLGHVAQPAGAAACPALAVAGSQRRSLPGSPLGGQHPAACLAVHLPRSLYISVI